MLDFVIMKASGDFDVDEKIIDIVRIKRSLNNKKYVTKMLSQLRFETPDFEFDTDLHCARLHIEKDNVQNAKNVLENVRSTLFKRIAGQKLLKLRYENMGNIGTLEVLANDNLLSII
jgi:hypothetical protein